ncbi:hypothetical protein D3C80_1437630 [compost metagenome]
MQVQGFAEAQCAQQRQWQGAALGHDPVEVGDPHGHQLDLGVGCGQVEQPASERHERFVAKVAGALREEDQRVALGHRFEYWLQGAALAFCALSLDQYAVEDFADEKIADAGLCPVVGSGHWAGALAQGFWQRRPQQHEVAVAAVVGEVQALHRQRRAAEPQGTGTGDQPGGGGDDEGGQGRKHGAVVIR